MTSSRDMLDTSHLSGISFLVGHPIAHSLSPLLHQTVYNALGISRAQLPFPCTDISQFLPLLKDPKCYGNTCQSHENLHAITSPLRCIRNDASQDRDNAAPGPPDR